MKHKSMVLGLAVLLLSAVDASAQVITAPINRTITAEVPTVLTLEVTGTPAFPGATDVAWRTAMETANGGDVTATGTYSLVHRGNANYNISVSLQGDKISSTVAGGGAGPDKSAAHLFIANKAVGTGVELLDAPRKGASETTNASVKLRVSYDDVPAAYSGTLIFTILAK